MKRAESILIPFGAIAAGMIVFGIFCALAGANPLLVYASLWKAGFGSWYSWQNTLVRASPLLLCGLCTSLPARAGIIVIGNEGALVVGGLGAISAGLATLSMPPWFCLVTMGIAAMLCGGLWIAFSVALQHYRGVSAVISGLLLNYLAIAFMNQLIEGPLRDPSSLNNPATYPLTPDHRLAYFSGTHVHHGILFGVIACLIAWILVDRTTFGFSLKISGGNVRTAQLVGLPVGKLVVIAGFLGGACAGLAGMIEVAAVHGRGNESLNAGYGYVGILVAFLSRQSPLGVLVVSVMVGGLLASGGMLQRAHDLPDATITVLQGILFLFILLSDTVYGRFRTRAHINSGVKANAVAV
ncbi:MAG: ral nucleoside transport system permease protein [Bryobacterales bacterium]|nr:ral nucleoside transport system permease protein [Bryobacterales bacterium]